MKYVILLFLLISNAMNVTAQQESPWAIYMTPADVHAFLAQYSGSFSLEIYMGSGESNVAKAASIQSEHNMLLGGRFLELKQQGTMMGMDYRAITTLGFNTIDHKMALTTLTNMGTGTLSLFGTWDHTTKSANLYGELTNPVSKKTIHVRQFIQFIDADTLLIESFDKEGKEAEQKTVTYKFVSIK